MSAALPAALSIALLGLLVHGALTIDGPSLPAEGLASLVLGTLLVVSLATLVAIPGGLLAAIYLAEFARPGRRRWLKPALELLAGVPTIVYGLVAVMVVGPLLHRVLPGVQVASGITAALVLSLMILPTLSSLGDDALRAVPRELREASMALGASRLRMMRVVVLPAAMPGIMAAVMLAVSRALGETMIMTLAAGELPRAGLDPRAAIETLTSYMGRAALAGPLDDAGLYAAGLALLVLSLVAHAVAHRLVRRRGRWS
ncbi:MAG: ABC transporter permease subunit [Myxococcales bacterium]|nr:ABC transporter permease subunit [Myxococcales bacterium]